jgi:hypothetical protein
MIGVVVWSIGDGFRTDVLDYEVQAILDHLHLDQPHHHHLPYLVSDSHSHSRSPSGDLPRVQIDFPSLSQNPSSASSNSPPGGPGD